MSADNVNRGLPMSDIRIGMRLKSTTSATRPIITVTEITEKGFRYEHAPHPWGPRFGYSDSGECYGMQGYSYYELAEKKL